jgi:hypothetical protein
VASPIIHKGQRSLALQLRTGEKPKAKRRALEAVLMALTSALVPACVDGGLVNLPRCVRLVALVLPL